jgi:hypothetical protein
VCLPVLPRSPGGGFEGAKLIVSASLHHRVDGTMPSGPWLVGFRWLECSLSCGYADRFPSSGFSRYTKPAMTTPTQPNIKLINSPDYREHYANSVQVRVSVWDFFMVFGTLQQQTETQVEIRNFQGVYLSPQQAKALLNILHQDVQNYENAFGEIKLDARMTAPGQVH